MTADSRHKAATSGVRSPSRPRLRPYSAPPQDGAALDYNACCCRPWRAQPSLAPDYRSLDAHRLRAGREGLIATTLSKRALSKDVDWITTRSTPLRSVTAKSGATGSSSLERSSPISRTHPMLRTSQAPARLAEEF